MKILITTDWYAPVINGVVTSVLNLERELRINGHEVRILTLSRNRHAAVSETVTYLPSFGAGKIYPQARVRFPVFRKLLEDLMQWHPDVIHSQCEFSTFLSAKHLASLLHIPLVHTYHTIYEDYTHYFSFTQKWGRQAVSRFSRWIASGCDQMIAPTEKVRQLLYGYGISQPITVIPTGIRLEHFMTVSPIATQQRKAELGIAETDLVCVYVGRLAKEKNIAELLAFYAALPDNSIKLYLIGDGPQRAELETLVQQYGISERVRFTGMVSPETVAEYYSCGDVFVSASTSETQGLTYIEALASGLPVLCRKDPCLDGVIQSGWNGFLYTTPEEYARFLQIFRAAPERLSQMQAAALQSARKFDCRTFAAAVEALYSKAISEYETEPSRLLA